MGKEGLKRSSSSLSLLESEAGFVLTASLNLLMWKRLSQLLPRLPAHTGGIDLCKSVIGDRFNEQRSWMGSRSFSPSRDRENLSFQAEGEAEPPLSPSGTSVSDFILRKRF